MEKSNNRVLNELLVNLFHNVMDAEAKAVITEEFKDITNNDMHILEAIGIEEPKSMSRIAGELHVTVGTLTTNMNSLEKKGYLSKIASPDDGRVTYISITEEGRKLFHKYDEHYFGELSRDLSDISEEDADCMIRTIEKFYQIMCERRSHYDK